MNVHRRFESAAPTVGQALVDARGVNEALTVYISSSKLFKGVVSWDDV